MPHFIPIKSGFGKKDDCGEWLRTKEPFPIDRRFGFGPEWMWQPCSCRPTTGSPQSVTTPLVCPPREETPMHTGTVGSSHSLFFFQCFHQLPYLMDLGSEWVFCPGRALQCSELELGIILWGKLFLPCTLWPFPHFFRFCQFKKREQQLLSGRYCRSGLERLSYFFFFHFAVREVSRDNTENHGVGGVASEDHWTFTKIPSRVQDQHWTAQALSCCTCAHT